VGSILPKDHIRGERNLHCAGWSSHLGQSNQRSLGLPCRAARHRSPHAKLSTKPIFPRHSELDLPVLHRTRALRQWRSKQLSQNRVAVVVSKICLQKVPRAIPIRCSTLLARLRPRLPNQLQGQYNAIPEQPNVSALNQYGGFDIAADNLMFVNGDADPWLYSTIHSPYAKPRQSTDKRPVQLILSMPPCQKRLLLRHSDCAVADCWHVCDMRTGQKGTVEPLRIQAVHMAEIDAVKGWLARKAA